MRRLEDKNSMMSHMHWLASTHGQWGVGRNSHTTQLSTRGMSVQPNRLTALLGDVQNTDAHGKGKIRSSLRAWLLITTRRRRGQANPVVLYPKDLRNFCCLGPSTFGMDKHRSCSQYPVGPEFAFQQYRSGDGH